MQSIVKAMITAANTKTVTLKLYKILPYTFILSGLLMKHGYHLTLRTNFDK